MKILGLRAENIKKLKVVEITPDGCVVKLTGANEQGKSSVLDSIWMALGGTKTIPEKPIREGETYAVIQLDLGDIIVTRTFTPTSDSLVVKNKDGAKFSSPQTMLDDLIGRLSFDPLEFITNEKKQVETLLGVVTIPVDYALLREIAGYDVKEERNPLDAINKAINYVKAARTDINRELTRDKKTLESYGTPPKIESVLIQDLFAEKEQIKKEREEAKLNRDILERIHESIQKDNQYIESIDQQIKDLYSKRKLTEDRLGDNVQQSKELQIKIANTPVPTFEAIDLKISEADATNAAARKYTEYSVLKIRVDETKSEYDYYGNSIKQLEEHKVTLLADTKFPIDGLGFTDGVVTYKNLPLSQASSAEKLGVGMAVGMALNPKLRIIIIRDASLLDSKHMAIVEQMAKDNDFQVWMELVDETGNVGIVLEDGEVTKING